MELGADFLTAITRAGLVGPVTLRSNLNADAPLVLDPFAPSEAPPSPLARWALALLKPEVTVKLPTGVVTLAPAGAPTANYLPLLLAALGLGLFSVFGLGGLAGAVARPRTLLATGAVGLAALALVASRTKLEEGT